MFLFAVVIYNVWEYNYNMEEEYITLWTYQTPELFNKVIKEGVGFCDFLSGFGESTPDIVQAYDWMCEQMRKRIAPPESVNAKYPLWAWRYYSGVNNPKPRKSFRMMDSDKEEQVFIELRVPKSRVLLSDFMLWHYPLNGGLEDEDYEGISSKEICEKIFDENFTDSYWVNGEWENRAIQACIWCIFPEDIVYADLLTKQEGKRALMVERIWPKGGIN